MTEKNTKTKPKSVSLPLSRVRLIMKSSPEVANISPEAIYLITLSAELFIEHLGLMALRNSNSAMTVDYKDLANVVDERTSLDFLKGIIPKKIKAKDYLEMLKNDVAINEDSYI